MKTSTFEESNRGLKITVTESVALLNCLIIVIVCANAVNIAITKKSNWCCLHPVVNSGTQNCANNREFLLKPTNEFICNLL